MPTNVRLVKAMVFPVVMYGCDSQTVEKAEHRRIDAFELWCWRRLLRVPWTTRRPNQSILKEISPGCSLEGLMLKMKLQYFDYMMWRANLLEKTLILGKMEGRGDRVDRGWDSWMASPTQWTWVWASSRTCWRTDTEDEAPVLWPPDAMNWLIGKAPDAGKDWRKEEKGMTADEVVGWHHQLNGHEFEQVLGVGDGQGSLAWCSPCGHKESDTTERLNWLKINFNSNYRKSKEI